MEKQKAKIKAISKMTGKTDRTLVWFNQRKVELALHRQDRPYRCLLFAVIFILLALFMAEYEALENCAQITDYQSKSIKNSTNMF